MDDRLGGSNLIGIFIDYKVGSFYETGKFRRHPFMVPAFLYSECDGIDTNYQFDWHINEIFHHHPPNLAPFNHHNAYQGRIALAVTLQKRLSDQDQRRWLQWVRTAA
jgi:hypothetical protein